jgi:hypothetical protein
MLSEIFLLTGLDRANQLETPRQSGVLAQVISMAWGARERRAAPEIDHLICPATKSSFQAKCSP